MGKIIIDNKSSCGDLHAVELVARVIAKGRISNSGKQFCYLVHFEGDLYPIDVISKLNKKSDHFLVVDSVKHDK